jgi:hypothetical protein
MDSHIIKFKSDWPLSLLLYEVQLRIKRVLIHKLEREGLWPCTKEYNQFMKRQKELGDYLISNTFNNVFGDNDYNHVFLNSEFRFGGSNTLVKKRLPYVASFGYEIGLMISNLINGKNKKNIHQASEMCSVFNVGIAIFDYIHDEEPDLFGQFKNIFNEDTLGRLSTDKQTCECMLIDCKNISSAELRLLSKIIVWFFLRLHTYYNQSEKKTWKKLNYSIISAYLAEINSSQQAVNTKKDSLITSRKKSTLPFLIIYFVVWIISNIPRKKIGKAHSVYYVCKKIGEIFWYTDDLIDLLKDLESNHLNSILCRIYNQINIKGESDEKYHLLIELLNHSHIEKIINQLNLKITSLLHSLEINNFREEDVTMVRNILLCFVRNWTE